MNNYPDNVNPKDPKAPWNLDNPIFEISERDYCEFCGKYRFLDAKEKICELCFYEYHGGDDD